jgi:hypothetical protein
MMLLDALNYPLPDQLVTNLTRMPVIVTIAVSHEDRPSDLYRVVVENLHEADRMWAKWTQNRMVRGKPLGSAGYRRLGTMI